MFGGGGYGFEAGDPKLHDKIAALKARRGAQSGKQRVNEFLEKELHVDPRDLPLDKANADARLKEIADEVGGDVVDLHGNSLGIKDVVFSTSNYPDATCPSCNVSSGYWDTSDTKTPHWYCYECEERKALPTPDTTVKTVTDNEHKGVDWHDLNRCWNAYVKHIRVDRENDEPLTVYSFHSVSSYYGVSTEAIVPEDPNPDVTSYPSGATLRIQRATFKGGDVDVDKQYVRVGGLFNETDIVNIQTMQPIDDLDGWTVIEEL